MKAGDLVFVSDKGIVADIIEAVDEGKFDHVAIAMDDKRILEAQYNVKVHIIDNPYTDFEVVSMNLGDKAKVEEFAKNYLGKSYDFPELIRIFFRIELGVNWLKKFNDDKSVVCSELAGDYLEFVGIAQKGEELLAPNELYNSVKALGY